MKMTPVSLNSDDNCLVDDTTELGTEPVKPSSAPVQWPLVELAVSNGHCPGDPSRGSGHSSRWRSVMGTALVTPQGAVATRRAGGQ